MTTTGTAAQRTYTFDTPTDTTIHVTAASEQQARDKLAEVLNMGLVLDIDAGDGVFVHQASTLVDHKPVLHAVDPDPNEDDEDAPAGRLVLDCGICGCHDAATQTVTYTLSEQRMLDFLCDRHAENYAARHDLDPVLAPLDYSGTRTMPVQRVRPWTRVWEMHGVPEWPQRQRFRWLVLHTVTYRSLGGQLRVRWTYQDGRTRDFDYDELVTGVFSDERPEV